MDTWKMIHKGKESLVLGLFGAWGSGKTSILNLALEHIVSSSQEKRKEEKPIIVRFNPWNYSEQNQPLVLYQRGTNKRGLVL